MNPDGKILNRRLPAPGHGGGTKETLVQGGPSRMKRDNSRTLPLPVFLETERKFDLQLLQVCYN